MRRWLFAACLLFALVPQAFAQPVATPRGMHVTLITLGSGFDVDERFGHNLLWFRDQTTGVNAAYQWGLFSFDEPNFLGRFLSGDNRYWMGAVDPQAELTRERGRGRPITLQDLNLSPSQVSKLYAFAQNNAREENKFYRYAYFTDNCSTRLRDALDVAVGGAISARYKSTMTSTSFRRESVRLTDGMRPIQTGIDIALGRPADAALSSWESFFIPMRLRDALRSVQIRNDAGELVPMIASEQVVPPLPGIASVDEISGAPRLAWRTALLGVLLGALVVVLRIVMVSRRSAAWGLALFGAGWSLLCGLIGVLLLLAWFATRHVFWQGNDNVLLLTPLSLFGVFLFPASLLSNRARKAATIILGTVAAMGLVAFFLALFPGAQENHAIVALFVPVHLALAWAVSVKSKARQA